MARAMIWPVILVAMTCNAHAEWKKIAKNAPPLDYALAYCDNQAMMMGGYRPQRLGNLGPSIGMGLTDLGGAIGAKIRESRFKRNCMTMNGWKDVRKKQKQ